MLFKRDLTSKIEKQVIPNTNKLKKLGIIDKAIVPNDRSFLVSMADKQSILVRPILSIVSTPTHKLPQWLAFVLRSMSDVFSENTVHDS